MIETLDEGRELPLDLKDNVIYYMGPSPAREGRPIGSAGPTTASRMDKYTPRLLDLGMGAMIGKEREARQSSMPSFAMVPFILRQWAEPEQFFQNALRNRK